MNARKKGRISWMMNLLIFPLGITLVVAFYFWTSLTVPKSNKPDGHTYYPLLGRAFVEGHCYLDVTPSPDLLALSDPYDPKLNASLRLHDASLYKGKYYLYFGPTPALVLFAPYYRLTGQDFPQKIAVPIFCSIGFIFSSLLFLRLVQTYLKEVPPWLQVAGICSLGLADTGPFLLRRPDVYEVAVSCAYAFLQIAFLSFYGALRQPRYALRWLLLTATCLGASAASRYNYALIGIVFFIGLIVIWRENRIQHRPHPSGVFLAMLPLLMIGLGIAWYNYARFDNPLEIGQKYQLAGVEVSKIQFSRLDNVPYNLWLYFCAPPDVMGTFPFIRANPWIFFKMPNHYFGLEKVAGLFEISPVSIYALTAPVLFFSSRVEAARPLHLTLCFISGATFVTLASILCLSGATMRYFVDFVPAIISVGCLMVCYFYPIIAQGRLPTRIFLRAIFALVLFLGCWNGVMLSFTGYDDSLALRSTKLYARLEKVFQPVEFVIGYATDWLE